MTATVSPTKPSTAGSNVIEASIVHSTVMDAPVARPRTKARPIRNMPRDNSRVPSRSDPASSTVIADGKACIAAKEASSSCPSNNSRRGFKPENASWDNASLPTGCFRLMTVREPLARLVIIPDSGVK